MLGECWRFVGRAVHSCQEGRRIVFEELTFNDRVTPRNTQIAKGVGQVIQIATHRLEATVIQCFGPQQSTEQQALSWAQLRRQERAAGESGQDFIDR
ncbi:hypothetical protein D3C85_1388460 [compost metagenome]